MASANRFAVEGAQVFIAGRRVRELEEAVAEVGHGAAGIACDISNMNDLDALFDEVQRREGRIDVLFANAGGSDFASLSTVTEEHFSRIFDTNVKGTFLPYKKRYLYCKMVPQSFTKKSARLLQNH